LEKAIEDIKGNVFTIRAAARAYDIPRTTLQQYINVNTRKHKLSAEHEPGKVGRYAVLGAEFEKELCDYAKKMSDLYFGITKEQLCKLAYEVAVRNNIKHNFSLEKKTAGNDWFQGFISRNRTLSLRKPESTSIARVIGFRRSEVSRFYDNLSEVYAKELFDASRVFNVDETGMSTVQQHKHKVIAELGKKQIGKIVSAEKGETITAVVCVSASGVFVPPMLIFPRKNLNSRLLHGAPPDTVGAASSSGWINSDLYLQWLTHFIKFTAASIDRKVLLILDNHESHISLRAWQMCRDNGIVVVSIPPHCSHKCQPLDLTVFGPLKTAYYKRCAEWLKMNPGKRITQYEVAALFGDAYCTIASVQKCINGFKAAGICPLNSSVFTDEDFEAADNLVKHVSAASSSTTEATDPVPATADTAAPSTSTADDTEPVPLMADRAAATPSTSVVQATDPVPVTAVTAAPSTSTVDGIEPVPVVAATAAATPSTSVVEATDPVPVTADTAAPSTSAADDTEPVPVMADTAAATPSTSVAEATDPVPVTGDTATVPQAGQQSPARKRRVSVLDISPLPTVSARENTRKRKCKRSEVLTASPMKTILESKIKQAGSSKRALVQKVEKNKKSRDEMTKRPKSKKSAEGSHPAKYVVVFTSVLLSLCKTLYIKMCLLYILVSY